MSSPIKPDHLNSATLKSVIHSGLKASRKLKKSMESLSETTLTNRQVCDIFKSQAELNRVNLAWNSVASLSLIHGQSKIDHLQKRVGDQGEQIEYLNYRLSVHQLVIQRLFKAVYILSQTLHRTSQGQLETTKLLKVLQSQLALTLLKKSSWTLANVFRATVGTGFKYGILAIISETILNMTHILSLIKVITMLIPNKTISRRFYIGARITLGLSLIMALRKYYERLLQLFSLLHR